MNKAVPQPMAVPFMAMEERRFSYPASLAYTTLTEYSRYSQPNDSQAIPVDQIELNNIASKTAESQINLLGPNPCIQITQNTSGTMHDVRSPLTHNFGTMGNPYTQPQVLVPNPLLSDITGPEGCISMTQHCLETGNVLSTPLPFVSPPLDENVSPYPYSLSLSSLLRTPVSDAIVPLTSSPLGMNDIPFSTVPDDQMLLEAHPTPIPVLSSAEAPTKSTITPGRDFSLVNTARSEAIQQQESGTVLPGIESCGLVNTNEYHFNSQCVHLRPDVNGSGEKSDIEPEEIQSVILFQFPDVANAYENREKIDHFTLVRSTSERCHGAIEDDSIHASHENTISNDQGDVSTILSHFQSFGQTPKRDEGHSSIMQAEKRLEQHGRAQNTIIAVSCSLQSNSINSKDKVSPVLRHDDLMETALLGRQQGNSATPSTKMIKEPPGKRRRLPSSLEEQIECNEYKSMFQNAGLISRQTLSFTDDPGCQSKESDNLFVGMEETDLSRENHRHNRDGIDVSGNFPVWRRPFSDASRQKRNNAMMEKQTVFLGTNKNYDLEKSSGERQNEQGGKECGMLESHENISNRNGAVSNQEHFISSGKHEGSSPSHIVRSVEQKGVCMFMALEVHEPAVCQSCDKKFPTQELLDLHISKKHSGSTRRRYRKRKREPKEFRCTTCSLRVANEANLRRHYQIVHKGETVETCSLCDANFNSHHGFVLHLRDQHGITPDSVQEKEGSNRKKRHYRRRNNTNVVTKPTWLVWKCGSCSFFSENKGNMTRHINIVHLKIADHTCEECSEVFKTKHNLQVHLMNHHPKNFEGRTKE